MVVRQPSKLEQSRFDSGYLLKHCGFEKLVYLAGLISRNVPKGCRGFESLTRLKSFLRLVLGRFPERNRGLIPLGNANAVVAQLVERHLAKVKAVGS